MKCGSCIECCTAFPVKELKKPAGKECDFANNGCNIYKIRPQSCKDCFCAWVTQPKTVIELRPDKCGVIFERDGQTMVGTIIGEVSSIIHGQIHSFKKQGFKVFMQKGVK